MTISEPTQEEDLEEEFSEDEPSKLGTIHMMYAIGKESQEDTLKSIDLMYVKVSVNGKKA